MCVCVCTRPSDAGISITRHTGRADLYCQIFRFFYQLSKRSIKKKIYFLFYFIDFYFSFVFVCITFQNSSLPTAHKGQTKGTHTHNVETFQALSVYIYTGISTLSNIIYRWWHSVLLLLLLLLLFLFFQILFLSHKVLEGGKNPLN